MPNLHALGIRSVGALQEDCIFIMLIQLCFPRPRACSEYRTAGSGTLRDVGKHNAAKEYTRMGVGQPWAAPN